MARGENTAFHPGRRVDAASVSTPTPDGGTDSRTAGPIIQSNWEALRDSGMSAEDATARLHTLTPTVHPGPASGTSPSWLTSQQFAPVAPNNATISGPTIPSTVRAPEPAAPVWTPSHPSIVSNLANFFHPGPPTVRTNSYGPVGEIINRHVLDQA